MKILICDLTDKCQLWMENFLIKGNYEVAGKISLSDRAQAPMLVEKSWDYLLVFEQGTRQFLQPMLHFLNIPEERVIYAFDLNSWLAHPAAIVAIVNPNGGGAAIYRAFIYHAARQLNYHISCTTAEGLNYIATSEDTTIMKGMYLNRQTYSQNHMENFYALANNFYSIDNSSGWFLDLGANIGTTGIYFTKKLTPNLKVLAFEPDAENFKLLRINSILNDVEEKFIFENLGLGVDEGEQILYRNIENPGGSGMFYNHVNSDAPPEKIKITSLDKYFADKNLLIEDVRYIWIDTEGFEPQVVLGAQNILRKNPAPLFMEFNPNIWIKTEFFAPMMALLTELYEYFIFAREPLPSGEFEILPIEKIWDYQNTDKFGDIFLIKKS